MHHTRKDAAGGQETESRERAVHKKRHEHGHEHTPKISLFHFPPTENNVDTNAKRVRDIEVICETGTNLLQIPKNMMMKEKVLCGIHQLI